MDPFPFRLFSTTTYDFTENDYNTAKNNLNPEGFYVIEVENATLGFTIKDLLPKVFLSHFAILLC